MTDLILVGAQRRITMMVKVDGMRKPQPFTFHPSTERHPNRVNRVPRNVWEMLRKKEGSPREDGAPPRSPLDEYLETNILWELSPKAANLVSEGKVANVSPQGPNSGAHRPSPREPVPVEGLNGLADINSSTIEEVHVATP